MKTQRKNCKYLWNSSLTISEKVVRGEKRSYLRANTSSNESLHGMMNTRVARKASTLIVVVVMFFCVTNAFV